MHSFLTILKRELRVCFGMPQAYILLIIYLILSGLTTLTLGGFIDANNASLAGFFTWQPWLFLFLGSAFGMGMLSEEYRSNTAEILLSMPVSLSAVVTAKFLAAWCVLLVGLTLTLPIAGVCAWLGEPDPGPIIAGYLGCALTAGCFLAIGQAASVLSRSQFVSFIISFVLGLVLLLAGFRPCNLLLIKWGVPTIFMDAVADRSINSHFEILASGLIKLRSVLFFIALILLFIGFTLWRMRCRHFPRRRRRTLIFAAVSAVMTALALAPESTPLQIDITEEKLFSLDAGTIQILSELDSEILLTVYYSRDCPELSTAQRRLAARLNTLTQLIENASAGRVRCTIVNPVSLQEQSDAEAAGLAPHITSMGELWFLGATIEGTSQQVIPEFTSDTGIEYQLLRAIAAAQRKQPLRLGILSTIPVMEHANIETRQMLPTWWAIQQLAKEFEIINIDIHAAGIPSDLALIMLIHPHDLDAELLESLNQYSKSGKPLLLCLDPLCRSEAQLQGRYSLPKSSLLPELLEQHGISVSRKIIADRSAAAPMTDRERGLEVLPTLLRLEGASLSSESPITAHLSALNLFCAGEITSELPFTPLAWSSSDAKLLAPYEAQRTAADILTDFQPDQQKHAAAAHFSGDFNAVIIADADFLHNSLCVNTSLDQFGAPQELPLSDNATFIVNAAQVLTGDARQLRLRSRGLTRRPFTRLEAIAKAAEERIQQLGLEDHHENWQLRREIEQLRRELTPDSQGPAREHLDKLHDEDAAARSALKTAERAVLHDLRKEFDRIERKIALLTTALAPAILACIAALIAWRRRA